MTCILLKQGSCILLCGVCVFLLDFLQDFSLAMGFDSRAPVDRGFEQLAECSSFCLPSRSRGSFILALDGSVGRTRREFSSINTGPAYDEL